MRYIPLFSFGEFVIDIRAQKERQEFLDNFLSKKRKQKNGKDNNKSKNINAFSNRSRKIKTVRRSSQTRRG